jgi:hypothetical protein
MGSDGSLLQGVSQSLATPFGSSMTWGQLAAVTVFVIVVAFAWRQVVLFIGHEI